MFRLILAAAAGLLAREAASQGIYGVTRRSPMLEKQATARRFFDAAGMDVTGGNPAAAGNPSALSPVAVPAGAGPNLSANPMAPRTAPPLVLIAPRPGAPALVSGTNRAVVRAKPAPPAAKVKP